MRTSEADLRVLKLLLSLIHLVRGSKKQKERHRFFCVNALSEGRGPFLHLFFWEFIHLEWNLWSKIETPPQILRNKRLEENQVQIQAFLVVEEI